MDEICNKAEQKLNALSSVTASIDMLKRRVLVNAFFLSQLSYCSLI